MNRDCTVAIDLMSDWGQVGNQSDDSAEKNEKCGEGNLHIIMKVGVIGAGAISDIYLTNMIEKFDNLEVVSIAANHLEHAQEKAEKYGIKACTVKEMLADPEIEMVVILTPASTHFELAEQALLAGKHVYSEKTITDDFEKTKELVKLADEKGLYLGSAPDTFFGAAWQTARKAVDEGLIGEIQSFAISTHRNNDLLLSLFSFLRMPGGDVLSDFGCYYLTTLVGLLGPVKRVGGIVRAPYQKHLNMMPHSPEYGTIMDTPNISQVAAVIQMESGVTGTFHINAESNMNDESYFKLYGTRGILKLTDPNQFGGSVKLLANTGNYMIPEREEVLDNLAYYEENSRGVGPADMAAAIEKGIPNRASKELAYHIHEVITGILKGGENGEFVDIFSRVERPVPVEKERIPVKNIGHVSLQMKNEAEMLHFYGDILGMKKHFTLTLGDLFDSMPDRKDAGTPEEQKKREEQKDRPWITYMKLADHQFVELFYTLGREFTQVEDRWKNYGYTKVNFEVDSMEAIREKLLAGGVELAEDIHPTVDGSREIKVFDPDGNEVQFTEYGKEGETVLKLSEDRRESCSHVKYTTQVAYQVKNAFNMLNFYTGGLGLRKAGTLTYQDLYESMKQAPGMDKNVLIGLQSKGNSPWIDYIEVAPHQYVELFHAEGSPKETVEDLTGRVGYQHLCLEVSDIKKAYDVCVANGIKPDTEISLGADGAYQFWLTDPDGNRLELMQYTEESRQVQE